MGHTSFNPVGELIVLRLTVGGVDPDTFRNVFVALDTGASTTMIPTEVAVDLGYDLSNPNEQMMTANGIVLASRIAVRKLTAIGETVENIDVVCHDWVCKVFDMRCSFWLVGGVCNPDFATHLSPRGAASM